MTMPRNGFPVSLVIVLLFPLFVTAIGCQTTVDKKTLPSAYYLKDGPEYVPDGPEFKLANQVQALEQYKLEREKLRSGLEE